MTTVTSSVNSSFVITHDGTQIYYKDWGHGQPVDQMFFLASNGYRTVAHDRRGHGRSSQPWQGNDMDTYADDLAAVIEGLGLRDAMLVGHSTGGGEITRYMSDMERRAWLEPSLSAQYRH
jgi:non-heme chloroperoxidase